MLVSPGRGPFPSGPVRWTAMRPPLGRKELRWARTGAVTRLARTLNPDAIIERYYNFGGEGILAGAALGKRTMLEVNAPVIDYPGSNKARLDRMLLVEPMRRWRERICRRASVIVTPSAAILPPATPSSKILELEWGADTTRFHPGATGFAAVQPAAGRAGRLRRRLPALARRRTAARGDATAARARHRATSRRCSIGDGPELPRVRIAARRTRRRHLHRRGRARRDAGVPGGRRHRRRAVHSGRARPVGPRLLLVAAQDLRVHGVGPSCRSRPALPRIAGLVAHEREGILYPPSGADGLADAFDQTARSRAAGPSRRGRARARGARLQLGRALPRSRSGVARCRDDERGPWRLRRVNVLVVTDAFPPVCGGSGWSTYELARGLRRIGHAVLVVQPRPGTAETVRETSYDGFRVLEFGTARAGAAVRPQLLQERAALRAARRISSSRSSARANRHRARAARDDVPAGDRGGAPGWRAGRSAPCATTGRSATGPT